MINPLNIDERITNENNNVRHEQETNMNETKKNAESSLLTKLSENINFYACVVLILIGLVGNLLTIYVLVSKQRKKKNSLACGHPRLNQKKNKRQNSSSSLSSSQAYMISLAMSDSVFLIAHLAEDIIPSVSSHYLFQLINSSHIYCKLILYLRNSARFCSSYLLVSFAYERFTLIKNPLKRIKFHNRKISRLIIASIYCASFLLNTYDLVINGLRKIEKHETTDSRLLSLMECDVLADFKHHYHYTVIAYVSLALVVPFLLVFFFNVSIARKLLTRRKNVLRHLFNPSDAQLNTESNTIVEKAKETGDEPADDDDVLNELVDFNRLNNQKNFLPRRSLSLNDLKKAEIEFRRTGRNVLSKNRTRQPMAQQNKSSSSSSTGEKAVKVSSKLNESQESSPRSSVSKQGCANCCKKSANSPQSSDGSGANKKSVKIMKLPEFNKLTSSTLLSNPQNPRHTNEVVGNHSLIDTKGKKALSCGDEKDRLKSSHSRYKQKRSANLAQKLKESDRATIILLLISICFVLLNLPYIISWLVFYVPYQNGKLADSEILSRFSFVQLAEVLHVSNFCVNFFMYYLASKAFRDKFCSKMRSLVPCYYRVRC